MKKLLCLLMAAAMLAGCSSKNNSSVSEIPPVDDTAVESPIIEYNASDFKEVEMELQIDDKAPALPLHRLDVSKLDFGKKKSPCSDPANDHRVIGIRSDANGKTTFIYGDDPDASYGDDTAEKITLTSIDTIDNGSIRYTYSDGSVSYGPPNEPTEGTIVNYQIDGDYIYMAVIYDVLCYGSHCFSIFRYEQSTNKLEEVYSYSGMEPAFSANGVTIIGGKLYYFSYDNSVYSMDLNNDNKVEKVYTIPEGSILWLDKNDSIIALGVLVLDEEGNAEMNDSGTGSKLLYYFYNVETGEVTTKEPDRKLSDNIWAEFERDPFQSWDIEEEPQTKNDIIVTENMRFNTGFKNVKVIEASEERVMFVESTTYSSASVRRLHSYDLNKKEDTTTNVTIIGDQFYVLNGNILSYNSGYLFYFVPDLGMAFRVKPEQQGAELTPCGLYHGFPNFIAKEKRDIKYGEEGEYVQCWDKSTELMWIDK